MIWMLDAVLLVQVLLDTRLGEKYVLAKVRKTLFGLTGIACIVIAILWLLGYADQHFDPAAYLVMAGLLVISSLKSLYPSIGRGSRHQS
ncbi:hypothetical protein [Sphingomonas sp. ERG5]|uniref:hypothetical protein n=1 Tax=Sphingomonas sp. ERG5 TaxID=1381597 RepID=UPI000A81E695|nr:hypothetical protein [Sphingomonas sp. ERG5]